MDSQQTKRRLPLIAGVLAALALAAAPAEAATYPAGFEERTVASGLTGPVGVAWTPDGRMLTIEKSGRLKVTNPGGTSATTILDLSSRVNSYWDRGLLGIAVDSSFASNRYIYLLYTYDLNPLTPDGSGTAISRLSRFELSPTNQVTGEAVILGTYTGGACPAPSNTVDCIPSEGASHSIGSVRSAPDGTLYVGSGDAASFSSVDPLALRTYNEQSMAGKILRVDRNGRGLPGHPFCPTNANLDHVCTKLYAKGFRNPYRFKLRPDGSLAVGDVGWNSREEVSLISAGGRSYGWPCYEGNIRTPGYRDRSECAAEYAKEGSPDAHVPPQHDYPHSGSAAVMAGPTYQGNEYPVGYRDTIFFGDYAAGFMRRLRIASNGSVAGVESFATGWSATDIEAAPNGDIVFVSFGDGSPGTGSVKRIAYSPGNGTPTADASASPTGGPAPLTVAFSAAGSSDPDGDPLNYSWDFGDGSTGSGSSPSHTYGSTAIRTATLTVSDGRGRSDTDTVEIAVGGSAPTPVIETPADEALYRDGDTISLRGSATDAQDGDLPASGLRWNVVLHHASHIHQVGDFDGVSQASFEALRDHDADSFYEVTLRAEDSHGQVATTTIQLRPETVPLSLRSEPPGAGMSYAGTAFTAPHDAPAAIGFETTIAADEGFTSDGRPYLFDGWSDGGARSHDITIPASATTLTARYLENKAAGMAAGASTTAAGFDPRDAVDGDSVTRWASEAGESQWWQVDLGRVRDVSAVELAWQSNYASRYEILTSLDGVNFTLAREVTLLAPATDRAAFTARTARYVRVRALESATPFGISFFEARVLGPADPPPPGTDLALNRPASASTTHGSGSAPGAANDGNSGTRWSSAYADGQWWQVDLGQVRSVDRVEVNWEAAYASAYRIQTSTDGSTFTTAASVSRSAAGLAATTFAPRDARFVRLVADTRATQYGVSFWDFRVLGPALQPPDDTDPPETSIDSGPSGTVTSTSADFEFSSDEGGSTFECRLDGGAWSSCTSPAGYLDLAAGDHTFDVRATDAAGNVDPTEASRSWTIEEEPPDEDLALGRAASASSTHSSGGAPGAANDGDSGTRWSSAYADGQWWRVDLGSVQNVDRVEVNWESAYASAYRIETSVDGSSFSTAAEVTRTGAGLATTTFASRAARWVRLTAVTRATGWGISFWDFRVFGPGGPPPDVDPPQTSLVSGTNGTVMSTSASFAFRSSEENSTFECRLDGGAWTRCTSPAAYEGLGVGQHNFQVRATDPAGNVDPTPDGRSWTVAPKPTYTEAITGTAGLRHWWRLGDSGGTAADSAGTNAGVFGGGPLPAGGLLAGDPDGSRDFDGVNDFVDLAPGPFGTPAQFSVEAWVRIDAEKNGLHFLVTNSAHDMGSDGFALLVNKGLRPQLFVASSSSSKATATSAQILSVGTTYHLAATYDGARIRLYVNGLERASVAYTGGITYATKRDLLLGRQKNSSNQGTRWLDGCLDEVALYDRALGAAEIQTHYAAGS